MDDEWSIFPRSIPRSIRAGSTPDARITQRGDGARVPGSRSSARIFSPGFGLVAAGPVAGGVDSRGGHPRLTRLRPRSSTSAWRGRRLPTPGYPRELTDLLTPADPVARRSPCGVEHSAER